MGTKMPKLIIIVGPTASDKSKLGTKLARKFNGELISADSRKIYKEVKIGTHTPRGNWTLVNDDLRFISDGMIWHLIDFLETNKTYTVSEYQELFYKTVNDIYNRQKITRKHKVPVPIVVGGTGLYINAIKENYIIPKLKPDIELRTKIENEIKINGLEKTYNRLLSLDQHAKTVVDSRNPRRVIRALEVCLKTGQPFTSQRQKGKCLFKTLQIGIYMERCELDKLINKRVDEMIQNGFVDEVKILISKLSEAATQKSSDYIFSLPILTSLGYREIISYISGEKSLDETVELIKISTRQYARRQMTWFKKDKTIKWVKNYTECEKLVKDFLKI